MREALELLDRDRLGYPRRIGLDPKTASGSAEAHLWFRLPAEKEVEIEDVQIRVDAKGLIMSGAAAIADTPTRLEWRENFRKAEFDTRISAEMTPDTRARAALGLHAAPWVEGPTPLQILYTRSGDAASAEVTADLTGASMTAEPLLWSKEAGVPGRARARLTLRELDVTGLTGVTVEAGDLNLAGNVWLGGAGGAPTRIALDRLAWGASRLEGVKVELGSSTVVRISWAISALSRPISSADW